MNYSTLVMILMSLAFQKETVSGTISAYLMQVRKCIRDFFLFSNRAKEQDISHSFYGMQQQMLEWDMQLVLMEKFI